MKVSVIVPVYNVQNYIEKCLLSIKNQSLKDFECLIIDDGSLDDSINIAHSLIDDDIRFSIYTKENGGLSDARNYGLDLAIGEYVCFVDSDDYIDTYMLERTYNVAKEEDSDVVCFDLFYEYENGKKVLAKGGYIRNTNYQEDKNTIFINHSANNKLFNRLFLSDYRFVYGLSYEDLASIPIWLGKANKVTYIPEGYYYYMQRDDSISHSYDTRIFDIYKALDNVKENLNLKSEDINELYIKQCLIELMLKIRSIKDPKQRKKYYSINSKLLNDNYPNWFNNKELIKGGLSFKWRIIALLLRYNQSSLLDMLYKKK